MFEPFRFSGHVENNVVVPDEGVQLPEGAKVEVRVQEPVFRETTQEERDRRVKAAEELLEFAKTLKFPPNFEFDRGLANERTDEY